MRPLIFDAKILRQYLRRHQIATLTDLKRVLDTDVDITVYRKLKLLDYRTSYTHRGSYYTLEEVAHFDDSGLWSHQAVWFSRYGTLLLTVEHFVNHYPRGFFASDLADVIHAEVHDALHQLVQQERLQRTEVNGVYLYTAIDPSTHRRQLRAQRTAQSVPVVSDVTTLQVSPDEVKASILLFYGLLNEQQRRLYAGLESIKLGRGGDTLLADLLDLDAHTVARGRQQLLNRDVASSTAACPSSALIPRNANWSATLKAPAPVGTAKPGLSMITISCPTLLASPFPMAFINPFTTVVLSSLASLTTPRLSPRMPLLTGGNMKDFRNTRAPANC